MSEVDALPCRTYIPQAPLSDFIAYFWSYERAAQPSVKERALPTGTLELVINLRDDRLRVVDRQHRDDGNREHWGHFPKYLVLRRGYSKSSRHPLVRRTRGQ